jgi:UPF0755 protein
MNEIDEINVVVRPEPPRRGRRVLVVALVLSVFMVAVSVATLLFASVAELPPESFPVGTEYVIPPGATLNGIASSLKEAEMIRSSLFFSFMAVLRGNAEGLHAGRYVFDTPLKTSALLDALATGSGSINVVPITIPEGTRTRDIARIAEQTLTNFDGALFEQIALPDEGYLFPETYHVPPTMTPQELRNLMRETFDEKIRTELQLDPEQLSPDIVILASVLEREGNTAENMGLIADILMSRLDIGMALQVDATLEYERGKGSAELSIEDLEEDSPYNTYTRRGLPPTPIANPGLTALRAALSPTPNEYLYYLTGNDGVFYYARTFEQHKDNKARYLR